jgi:hypothetical protein
VGSDRIWRSQGAGFWGTRGPVSRELDARNSCEHSKSIAVRGTRLTVHTVFPKAEPVLASIPISNSHSGLHDPLHEALRRVAL